MAAAGVPAAALGTNHGVPDWVQRMMGDAPPEMQRMMRSPEMRRMMEDPPPRMMEMLQAPGMQRMMEDPPPDMKSMMEAPTMQRRIGGVTSPTP